MKKLQWIFGIFLLLAIICIPFFSQASQQIGLLHISPTPTIDLSSQFQVIQPTGSPPLAQQQGPISPTQTYGVAEPMPATLSATIKTSKGDIHINLFASQAPHTVQNFVTKAQNNYYNGLLFHRVEDWVVQGGDPHGDGTGGGQMSTELNNLPFTIGSLGIARATNAPIQISNDSQFFITKKPADWLNAQYTNFGIVTDGMSVVNAIQIGDKITGITIETPHP